MLKNLLLAILFQFPAQSGYVNDFADVLDQQEVERLEKRLANLDERLEIEIIVVTEESLGNQTAADFATKIRTNWGIQVPDTGKNILMLLSKNEQLLFVAPGEEVAEYLSPDEAQKIADQYCIPLLREGDYSDSIVRSLDILAGKLIDAAGENKSTDIIGLILALIVGCMMIWVIYQAIKTKYIEEKRLGPPGSIRRQKPGGGWGNMS